MPSHFSSTDTLTKPSANKCDSHLFIRGLFEHKRGREQVNSLSLVGREAANSLLGRELDQNCQCLGAEPFSCSSHFFNCLMKLSVQMTKIYLVEKKKILDIFETFPILIFFKLCKLSIFSFLTIFKGQ